MPRLTVLFLSNNLFGDLGVSALAEASAKGALSQLTRLELEGNQIGDSGLADLANEIERGALVSLETLALRRNSIGDLGFNALASALEAESGALELKTLLVDDPNHAALNAACRARGISLR